MALVTLPCPALRARALRQPGPFALHQPGARVLSRVGAAGLLLSLGVRREEWFGLRLDMPAGGGAGASTAARVALARAAGVTHREAIALARLCSEGAVDPLMLDDPGRLLWASRAGYVRARLPSPLRMEIVGGFFGPMRRTDPGDAAFPDIADLSEDWPAACGDLTGVAALASESARRTIRLRGPADDPTETLASATGALGFVIAHTGAARGLIFAPGIVPETTPAALRAAGFCHILRFRIGSVR
ncbi:MAG: biphenyl 2,3-dioxygenase [Acetobacteraceae bacterium]